MPGEKFDYTQVPCYVDVVRILSDGGDKGATLQYMKGELEGKGYTVTSMIEVLQAMQKDGKVGFKMPVVKVDQNRSVAEKVYVLRPSHRKITKTV